MEIVLFERTITNEALTSLEGEAKKYEGLYVDMEDSKQRKFVKDNAAVIGDIRKKLNRQRIDIKKEFNANVDAEAAAIDARLDEANKPYTLLIDDYKEKRAKILAKEKARKEAIELAEKIEADHELALFMDKAMTAEAKERKAEKELYEQKLKDEAAEVAEKELIERQNAEAAAVEYENQKRLSDVEHKKNINNSIVYSIIEHSGVSDEQAKAIVIAIAKNLIPNTVINY